MCKCFWNGFEGIKYNRAYSFFSHAVLKKTIVFLWLDWTRVELQDRMSAVSRVKTTEGLCGTAKTLKKNDLKKINTYKTDLSYLQGLTITNNCKHSETWSKQILS